MLNSLTFHFYFESVKCQNLFAHAPFFSPWQSESKLAYQTYEGVRWLHRL